MSDRARVLVAGVGNVFLGDDGFGVEVARRLAALRLPDGVEVADFGIRGVHLAYQLLDGYDTLVLIDTVGRDAPPGTLFVIEPGPRDLARDLDPHGFDPGSVLDLARTLGCAIPRVLLLGCVPARLEESIGLSPPVERAVEEAIRIVTTFFEQPQLEEGKCSVGSS